jgi:diguanylate cyclase (GGDEF)-like protein/PAS domain S-box-containing protein
MLVHRSDVSKRRDSDASVNPAVQLECRGSSDLSRILIRRRATPVNAGVLLVTRDRDLIRRIAESSSSDPLTIDYVDHLSQANRRLKAQGADQVLAVDLSALSKHECQALRVLMLASPDLPVLIVGNDDDPVLQARLLAQGAQDVLLKCTLNGCALRRAAQHAMARKAREMAMFEDNERTRATLASIGDGVLSTDNRWVITFMNPIAEKLTGWTCAQAVGHHVSDVFQVLDGDTRAPIMPQIEIAVGTGATIILPPNCVLVRRNGQELHIEDSAAPIHSVSGEFAGMVVVFHDVSESRARTQKMSHLAEHDVLTALPNRALLNDRLEHGIALAHRHSRQMAVLFIDLDRFKHINDSLGHLIGDRVLKAVAQRIIPCIRQSDTVSRYGGDEFVVLLSEVNRAEDAAAIAEKIRLAVMEPYTIDNHYLHLTTSIGVSVYPNDGRDASTLIQYADTAMYHAKEKGRNNSQFFKDDMNVRAEERQIITGDLHHALLRGEFFLVFQPKINLIRGNVTGFEALIRWRHPTRGVLSPAAFIPIAEESGLIIPIGEWVLREACAQARHWLDAGLQFETMAVNISAVEFRSDSFFDGICRILRTTGLDPCHLEIELTETAVMRDFEATRIVLQALSAMGMRTAVDDFGTGYSNLSYLKRFPINTLKLDRSFVHDVPESADVSTIVSSVIRMAHGLHLQVTGEGVETLQQLKFLKAHDCDEAQGYYFSKPLDPDECRSLLVLTKPRWFRQFSSPSLIALK